MGKERGSLANLLRKRSLGWRAGGHSALANVLLLLSRSVVSNTLRPHGLQRGMLPCPSPSPGACSNSCPLSQWCHPTISSSVVPFSSRNSISRNLLKLMSMESVMLSNHLILCHSSFCLQSFPASGSFPVNQFFASGGQSIETLASASVLSVNIQGWA